MARRGGRSNIGWETPKDLDWQHVLVEVLTDVRDELQKLNSLMHCPNTLEIPRTLERIDRRLSTKIKLKGGS
jgi:hypothetical protein